MSGSADRAGVEAAGLDPIAVVDAWRARGAAAAHPVGLRIVDALARRAEAQQGEARRLMVNRVEQLVATFGAIHPVNLRAAEPEAPDARRAALDGLSELVDRLGRTPQPGNAPPRSGTTRPGAPSARPPAPEPLNAVTAFKGTWSRLRADQRLRQALSQVPAMAGPLNSSHVVNRTLQAMRELSPAYLDAFMAHVDTLLWLERATGGDLPPRPAPPKEPRKTPRTSNQTPPRQTGA